MKVASQRRRRRTPRCRCAAPGGEPHVADTPSGCRPSGRRSAADGTVSGSCCPPTSAGRVAATSPSSTSCSRIGRSSGAARPRPSSKRGGSSSSVPVRGEQHLARDPPRGVHQASNVSRECSAKCASFVSALTSSTSCSTNATSRSFSSGLARRGGATRRDGTGRERAADGREDRRAGGHRAGARTRRCCWPTWARTSCGWTGPRRTTSPGGTVETPAAQPRAPVGRARPAQARGRRGRSSRWSSAPTRCSRATARASPSASASAPTCAWPATRAWSTGA